MGQASAAVADNVDDGNDESDVTGAPEPRGSEIRDRQTSDASERESFRYSPPFVYNLPGPSQVVTHPGTSGTNSNGERQRRRGVSGPPTGRDYSDLVIFSLIFLPILSCASVSYTQQLFFARNLVKVGEVS